MTRARFRVVQRVIGIIAILAALSAVATMFLPFRILDIQCGPAITGSKVEIGGPVGSLVQDHEAPICHNKGTSRLITAGVVFVLAAGLGYGGWFLPLEPSWYRAEEDDDGGSYSGPTTPAVPPRTGPSGSAPATPVPAGPVPTKPRVLLGDHVRAQRADDGGDDGDVEASPPERSPVPARGRPGAGPASGPRPARPPGGSPVSATHPARRPARPPAPATGAPGRLPDRPARPPVTPPAPARQRRGPGASTGRSPVRSPPAKPSARPPSPGR